MTRNAALVLACLLTSAQLFAATYVVPSDRALVKKAHAIVVARPLGSHVEESPERGIETVTRFAVEELLKGSESLMDGFSVRVPGGVLKSEDGATRVKLIPGAPRFAEGEHLLLFLMKDESGDYVVTDFALGLFGFATDDLGRRVLVRAETEISGWDLEGKPHRESRRTAARFLRFIREITDPGNGGTDDYTIDPRPLVGESPSIEATRSQRAETQACNGCTKTQYTFSTTEANQGARWSTFPIGVNWNRGNAATNAPNSGSDAINAAFAAWNGDPNSNVSYVLATAVTNSNGIQQSADGVNNVIFEASFGSDYTCSGGGLLGAGGVQSASGTNELAGETFYSIVEADVSMNRGVNTCIGGSLTIANFNSAMAHEIGHTLGLRHSDKSRDSSASCFVMTNYDCSVSSVMSAILTGGIAAALQPWDRRAVAAVYPDATGTPSAPTGIVATATSSTSVAITWNAVTGAASYQVWRTGPAPGGSFALVGSPVGNSFTDTSVTENSAYRYRVRSVNAAGTSGDSAWDLATTVLVTDDPIVPGVTVVKAVHLTEIRSAVNAVRALAGLSSSVFTDTAPVGVLVKAVHVTEMRAGLDDPRLLLGLPALTFSESALPGGTIKAIHFTELRNAIK